MDRGNIVRREKEQLFRYVPYLNTKPCRKVSKRDFVRTILFKFFGSSLTLSEQLFCYTQKEKKISFKDCFKKTRPNEFGCMTASKGDLKPICYK